MNHNLVRNFETAYLNLFWKLQRCQWENYTNDAGHDVSDIDEEMFKLVTSYKNNFEFTGHSGEIFKAILTRDLVDKHPDVSKLRNRLDLDNQDRYYGHGLSPKDMIRRIKPDVLALMQTRNRLSLELGFASYVDLVLFSEGLELKSLVALLKQHLERNLGTAKALVEKHHISLTTSWFIGLDRIGHFDPDFNLGGNVTQFLECIGFGHLLKKITLIVQEQATVSGYVGILSTPDDIRILIRTVNSLENWLTLFHELGHATAHALNEASGIFKTWTSVYDETMAEVLEPIAAFMLLNECNQQRARELRLLTSTRCAISGLFELALWGKPEEAERLYLEHFSKLGLQIHDPETWVLDSFRSLDPVYIFNYVIGYQIANRTLKFLKREYGNDFPKWGEWLRKNYYADGRKRSLQEKTKIIDGNVKND